MAAASPSRARFSWLPRILPLAALIVVAALIARARWTLHALWTPVLALLLKQLWPAPKDDLPAGDHSLCMTVQVGLFRRFEILRYRMSAALAEIAPPISPDGLRITDRGCACPVSALPEAIARNWRQYKRRRKARRMDGVSGCSALSIRTRTKTRSGRAARRRGTARPMLGAARAASVPVRQANGAIMRLPR